MLRSLLDLVYPRSCVECRGPVDSENLHLCWDCLAQVPFVQSPFCAWCGDPVDGRVDDAFVCFNCAGEQPSFDRARSAVRYRGPVRTALQHFKYNQAVWLRHDLGRLLESCVRAHFDTGEVDAVAFVPLHPARRRSRGYNQSELLARALAGRLRKPLLRRALRRVRPTQTQTNLTGRGRASNVKGAFRAGWFCRLRKRRVLLVDDVMTTGATVNECARALKAGGAARVYVVTVARG